MSSILASRWAPAADDELPEEEARLDESTKAQEEVKQEKVEIEVQSDTVNSTSEEISQGSVPAVPKVPDARVKKRVTGKTKQYLIWLPSGPPEQFGGQVPLTKEEIQQRLLAWHEAGYDTAGFDHQEPAGAVLDSDAKALFAAEQDSRHQVKLPNLQAWKGYVDWLTEEKLRALGVGGVDETRDGTAESTAQPDKRTFSPSHSAQLSAPCGFLASSRTTPGLSTGSHSRTMSIASPVSSGFEIRGHAHRHSIFGMPQGFSHMPSFSPPMRAFSPANPASLAGMLRSESTDGTKSQHSSGPGFSAFGDGQQPRLSPLSDLGRWSPAGHVRHYSMAAPSFAQQSPALASRLPVTEETAEATEAVVKRPITPEQRETPDKIHQPTPRGHRHNVSDSLEREIRDAEAALEAEEVGTAQAQQLPASEPVAFGSLPVSDSFTFRSMPQQSSSKFHFDAPAFIPGALHAQPAYDFNHGDVHPTFNTLPSSSTFAPTAPSFQPSGQTPFTFGASTGSINNPEKKLATPKFNVAAASFEPQASKPPTMLPSSSFDFSHSHVFRPGAASFEPASSAQPQSHSGSIFGNVEISETSRPARRSKAVAIVRPVSSHIKEAEEDESGRLVQSADRQKRAFRQADDEGDSMPLFAERPSSPAKDILQLSGELAGTQEQPQRADTVLAESESEEESEDDITITTEIAPHPPASVRTSEPTEEKLPSDFGVDGANLVESSTVEETPKRSRNTSVLSALAKPFTFEITTQSEGDIASISPLGIADLPPAADLSFETSLPDLSPARVFSGDAKSRSVSNISIDPTKSEASLRSPSPSRRTFSFTQNQPAEAIPRKTSSDSIPTEAFDEAPAHAQAGASPRSHAAISIVSSPRTVQLHDVSPTISRSPSPLPIDSLASSPRITRLMPDSSNIRPSSEWSEFGSAAASQLNQRSDFFDVRIDELISKAFKSHIEPLQQQLGDLKQSLASWQQNAPDRGRRVVSSSMESDADDEDDLVQSKFLPHPVSRARARRFELTKAAVLDALATQRPTSEHDLAGIAVTNGLAAVNDRLDQILRKDTNNETISAIIGEAVESFSKAVVHSPASIVSNEEVVGTLTTKEALRFANGELEILRLASSAKDDRIRELEERLSILSSESAAQRMTLDEYRASRSQWKQDQEDNSAEQQRLRTMVSDLEDQVAEGLSIRDTMREKLDRIHTDMASVAEQMANQKVTWQRENEVLSTRCAVLQAQLDHATEVRHSLEAEVPRLQMLVSEGDIAKLQLQQSRATNALLEDTIKAIRDEMAEQQTETLQSKQQMQQEREDNKSELQRARSMMDSAIESANTLSEATRAGLERKLANTTTELEDMRTFVEAMKVRHDARLQEESDLRRDALLKVNEASSTAMELLRKGHDEVLQAVQSRHERALQEAQQDKERTEKFWSERLNLSEGKNEHLHERISHLEERLEIAKSAAQAAASAAQAAKAAAAPSQPAASDRISPQALRESILVLQEQLQDREAQIERLQAEAPVVDETLPAKLKEKDIEINWLRELLAVRSEDLNELITNLSAPSFDKAAARDTAIRIRTALQMEQAEKERHIAAGSSLSAQAVAIATNFASPKAAQLAAAFGSWRARGTPSGPTPSSLRNARRAEGTPAKRPTSSSSWMSGLMTPPASGTRRTPSPHSPSVAAQNSRPDSRGSEVAAKLAAAAMGPEMPATPDGTPIGFRRGSYDDDAELRLVDGDEFDMPSPMPQGRRMAELEPLA